ncbi:MAG TPA: carbohydrate ABC transporter permease [Oscillospiraceae bacterium]|nr:carbohydrate ABC transporter permease [Oscillospiraceae bacterium]
MKEKLSFKKGNCARSVFRICNLTFMIILMISMLIPLLKVLSDSLDKTTTYGINLWPKNFSFDAYKTIFTNENLYMPFLVSCFTTIVGTSLGLIITTLGAYVLNQKDLIGRAFLSRFIFITMIFNGGLVPTFLVLKGLKLTDTLAAVLLPLSVNVFNMILMRNFFEQVPGSLFESAEIDGCTPMRTFISIALPLSLPAIASIGLFFAVQYWNEFFSYVMYISTTSKYNFQVKLRELIINEQTMMDPSVIGFGNMVKNAAVIVAMLPFMFIYPFAQRFFITGVTMGAVKE